MQLTPRPARPAPPPTYMGLAIVGALTGPVPLAFVAIYHASRVDTGGDQANPYVRQESLRHSRLARNWSIVTLVVAIVAWTAAIIAIMNR